MESATIISFNFLLTVDRGRITASLVNTLIEISLYG